MSCYRRYTLTDAVISPAFTFENQGSGVDHAPAFEAAWDAAVTAGGGTVILPPGVMGWSTASVTMTPSDPVNVIGPGGTLCTIQKIGGTTTPLIEIIESGGLDMYVTFAGFYMVGSAKAHVGLRLENLARFQLNDVRVHNCSIGLESAGSLVFDASRLTVTNCVTGTNLTLSPKSAGGNVWSNHISFDNCVFVGNTTHAVELGRAAGVYFRACNFESNGTADDLTTGGIMFRGVTAEEFGFPVYSVRDCWFELNNGRAIQTEAFSVLNYPHLSVQQTAFISQEPDVDGYGPIIYTGTRLYSLTLDGVMTNDGEGGFTGKLEVTDANTIKNISTTCRIPQQIIA